MFSTLSSAMALHELFRNSDWFDMAEFTHLTGLGEPSTGSPRAFSR